MRQSNPPGAEQRLRRMLAEGARYAGVSAFSFVWILSCSALLHEAAGASEQLAVAVALASALLINFTLLRIWVFPGQTRTIGGQLLATAATSAAFRAVEYGLFLALNEWAGLYYLAATAIAVSASALAKFVVYRNVVFSARTGSAEAVPPGG